MKLSVLCCVLVILNILNSCDGKRGGGGSRGGGRKSSSGGSSWFWSSSSNKKSSPNKGTQTAPDSIPKQAAPAAAKPSAPDSSIKKETAHVQHSSNPQQQRPVGWDVPGSNTGANTNPNGGWKNGYQGAHQQSNTYPTGNQPHNAHGYPSQQQQGPAYPQQGHSYSGYPQQQGQGHPGYPQQQGHGYPGYPQQQGHGYPGYPQQQGHGYPGYPQQGGYGGYGGGMGGYGGGMGGYGGGMGGYGGGMGGYGGGMSGFGGGMGGFGGGYGGYGMQKKSGFFSGSTFRNVLTGMFIWHMTSSLLGGFQSKRPYNVYNYYNQPAAVQEEIKLPSNVLTLCEGNVTQLCTGSTAICTTNSTVLCVVTMSQTAPCVEEKTLCVNATVPAEGQTTGEAVVNVPCFANLTMDVNLLNETKGGGEEYKYCVTTMAVGGPEYKTCEEADVGSNDWRSVLAGNYTWYLMLPSMRRPYAVYNYRHQPAETPSGEVTMPASVLVTCAANASLLCAPIATPVCTTFNEIMCVAKAESASFCDIHNTTCVKVEEGVEMPCFSNVTVDAPFPDFDIKAFDATKLVNSSYTYHFRYCVTTLGIPGDQADVCIYGEKK